MQCYAEQYNQLRSARGTSGESSICVATLAGSFIGDKVKTCSKCRQIKTLREFSKNCTQKDGYCNQCKECVSEYIKKYRETEQGKNANRICSRKFRIRHPNRIQATIAANKAVRAGKLPRPDVLICILCWGQAKEYHHPKYDEEYWLEVIPVCKKCHVKIHKQFRKDIK